MIIARRQHGTGEWLLKASDYLDWRAGMQSTLLCPGIPGAGKTMMVSIIIDDLWKQFEAHNDIAVVYLYCSFKRQQEQRLVDLLATLVRQLFQERSHLPGTVRSMYQRHVSRNTRPSIDELRDVLRSLTGTYSRVFFVVDALDECTNLDRTCDVLLAELFQLQALSKDSMAILATSRFIPEILDQFRNATRLEIRASEEDVGRYLDGQMPRLASCVMRRAELKEKIKIKIIESVDGMYAMDFLLIRRWQADIFMQVSLGATSL
jgi:Cdc6-like AAA superfamily ATPase